jgi:hypothetical protein
MSRANQQASLLDREEYVEQAHFFQALGERIPRNEALQESMRQLREEVLSTTKLPMAIAFLLAELRHCGTMATAMRRLSHYFTPFQTYVIAEAENDRGRFDMRVAVEILRFEAEYRSGEPARAGAFMYQFEALCRNRLRYELGLDAMALDPIYDDAWRSWLQTVRRQIGIVDFADLVYVRSQHYVNERRRRMLAVEEDVPILFGEKEGKIAAAHRRKDPLFFFAALQRHLGYPEVPRLEAVDDTPQMVEQLMRRVERMEVRIKLLEDEQRGGIDITKFYGPGSLPGGAPKPMD